MHSHRHQSFSFRRMDRLRRLRGGRCLLGVVVACLLALGCNDKPAAGPAPSRFDAVKSQQSSAAMASFCDRNVPAQGPQALRLVDAPRRDVPGRPPALAPNGTWRWLNLWASWCAPCLEEMALIGKWKSTLLADGLALDLELLSIDEDEQAFTKALTRDLPGRVSWLKSIDDLGPFLTHLGVDKNSAIPIHVFVDPQGMLRCVRVGSVREGDFGSIRALLSAT